MRKSYCLHVLFLVRLSNATEQAQAAAAALKLRVCLNMSANIGVPKLAKGLQRQQLGFVEGIKAHRIQRLFPQSWSPQHTTTTTFYINYTLHFHKVCGTSLTIIFKKQLSNAFRTSSITTMPSKLSTAVVLSLLFSSAVLAMPVGEAAGSTAVQDKVCKISLLYKSPEILTGRSMMVAIQPNKASSAGKRLGRANW